MHDSSIISSSATWGNACHVIHPFLMHVFISLMLSYASPAARTTTSVGQWMPSPVGQSKKRERSHAWVVNAIFTLDPSFS